MNTPQTTWRKSSRSQGTTDNCVEVTTITPAITVRDSKNPNGPKMTLTQNEWRTLISRIKHGTYDLH